MPTKARKPAANSTTVWEIDQAGEQDGIHPTQKPTEVFVRPIESHTLPSEIALEPFSGSGTQIIAAERLGRRCFALELSPAYVDVAVRRWEQATGKQATLEATGKGFSEREDLQ
jgi:DNA modification methylase